MNGDVLTRFGALVAELGPEDGDTLSALDEALIRQTVAVEWQRMGQWYEQGWRPNAPGLVCRACGERTWGMERGGMEMIRCVDPGCGCVRTVMTKRNNEL